MFFVLHTGLQETKCFSRLPHVQPQWGEGIAVITFSCFALLSVWLYNPARDVIVFDFQPPATQRLLPPFFGAAGILKRSLS